MAKILEDISRTFNEFLLFLNISSKTTSVHPIFFYIHE